MGIPVTVRLRSTLEQGSAGGDRGSRTRDPTAVGNTKEGARTVRTRLKVRVGSSPSGAQLSRPTHHDNTAEGARGGPRFSLAVIRVYHSHTTIDGGVVDGIQAAVSPSRKRAHSVVGAASCDTEVWYRSSK